MHICCVGKKNKVPFSPMPKSELVVWKFLKRKSVKDYCLSQVVLGGSWMVLGGYCGWKSVRNFENPRTMSQHKNLASEAPQRLNKEWNMSISKKFDWISVYFSWIDKISDGSWRFLVVLGVFAQKQGVCRNIALPFWNMRFLVIFCSWWASEYDPFYSYSQFTASSTHEHF